MSLLQVQGPEQMDGGGNIGEMGGGVIHRSCRRRACCFFQK